MSVLHKYTIVVESTQPPNILLGQNIGGAVVTELKQQNKNWFQPLTLLIYTRYRSTP